MKFLQAAVLSAICVGYVTASHPGYVGYVGLFRAIDEGRLDIAVELGKRDETLGEMGVDYVIKTRTLISSPTLSTKLIRQMHVHSMNFGLKAQ